MDAAQKPLNYGDFLPAKKTRLSQKIDQSQGNFLRVKPRQAKAQQNLSVIDEISALSVPDSVSDCDFVLDHWDNYYHRLFFKIIKIYYVFI